MATFIVLDLDEAMLRAHPISMHELANCRDNNPDVFYMADMHGQLFRVQKRKHLDEFIEKLVKQGKRLIVWSSGEDYYVKTLCDVVFGNSVLDYVLTREHQKKHGGRGKNIAIIKEYVPDFDIKKAILIDDKPDNAIEHPSNLIAIKAFYHGEDDALLKALEQVDRWKLPTGRKGAAYLDDDE